MAELLLKILPSTEKCFLDDKIEDKLELCEVSMLKNERLSFQLAYTIAGPGAGTRAHCAAEMESPLADRITITKVEPVPVELPIYPGNADPNYLRKEPGLYPDLLVPFTFENQP
ncbi:MAG: hypothetical protein J6C52_03525, partial [Clostridia bacterium]|nr:hypothetical protein [Clostridia bacterium]